MKLHQKYPHRKKRIPPLSRKLVFFANRKTQKNMQLLDKIHTVFTAALNTHKYICKYYKLLFHEYYYVWSHIYVARVWINPVRLPILLVVS